MGLFGDIYGDPSPENLVAAFDNLADAIQMSGGAIGEGSVLAPPLIPFPSGTTPASPFIHHEIKAVLDGAQWNGYVGNGFLAGAEEDTVNDAMETWEQIDVKHHPTTGADTSIKLDVTDHPFTNGIQTLIDGSLGFNLTASTTYYVYLKLTMRAADVHVDNRVNYSPSGTIVFDHIVSVVTSFETALQKAGPIGSIPDPGTSNYDRWFLLGVVKTGTASVAATVGQLSRDAIYLPTIYRGRVASAAGLGIDGSSGDIINTGVHSLVETNADLTLTSSGGSPHTGDVSIDPP